MQENSSDIWIALSTPEAEARFRDLVVTMITIDGRLYLYNKNNLHSILIQKCINYDVDPSDVKNIVAKVKSEFTDHTVNSNPYFSDIKHIISELEEFIANDTLLSSNDVSGLQLCINFVSSKKKLNQSAIKTVINALNESFQLMLSVINLKNKRLSPNLNDGTEMVFIPAGSFIFGEKKEEKYLPAFNIMKYPVTVSQYRKFCEENKYPMPEEPKWKWQDDHPMVNVTWHDAMAFAAWSGLSLPTEEEWEKAAGGFDRKEYPWGDNWDASMCCNSVVKPIKQTSAVGTFSYGKSQYGLIDVSGNIWEWCDSLYNTKNSKKCVMRGGAWDTKNNKHFRVTYRDKFEHTGRSIIFGFRCVYRFPEIKI